MKVEEHCIHGRDMVEDFHLSLEAIKLAKRTGFGANTEMQIFAVGIQRGMDEVKQIQYRKIAIGLRAIQDYIDLHFARQSKDDVQYLNAIDEKTKELLRLVE